MSQASEHRPTVAIINLNAIQHNVREMKRHLEPDQALYAVVKANAYGHGAVAVAKAALAAGAQGLAVATVDEGIELRQAGLLAQPILILGLVDPRAIAELVYYRLTVIVSDLIWFQEAWAQLVSNQQESLLDDAKLKVHLALDTGMGRIGLRTVEEVQAFAEGIQAFPWVNWEGVDTHFSTAGGGDPAYVETQWAKWQELLTAVPDSVTVRHYANSAMGVWFKRKPVSSIERFGISMYGMHPKDERSSLPIDLQPALQLISEIVYVKQVEKGSKISYGATYEAQEDEWVATIPIGYADGWFRHYKDIPVLVEGHACPVLGVINMDQLMIRLPHQVPVGTTVTLIGQDHHLENHAADLARQVGTISYEIFCGLSDRIPRIYLQDEEGED